MDIFADIFYYIMSQIHIFLKSIDYSKYYYLSANLQQLIKKAKSFWDNYCCLEL